MLLKNFWYAVEFSQEIGSKPKQITFMGQKIALYRNSKKELIALGDQCPHRGAPLSAGKVIGDCLSCPYHGWKYNAEGKCVEIPSNLPTATISARVHVEAYPVQEKYGLVWLFYGDLAPEESPPIPPFPEYDDPSWRILRGESLWQTHYTRAVEAFLDTAHVPFVHTNSFGSIAAPRLEDMKITFDDYGGNIVIKIERNQKYRSLQFGFGQKKEQVTQGFQEFRLHLPNITILKVFFTDFSITLFNLHVPVSESTTLNKWVHMRNFLKTPLADGNALKKIANFTKEDQTVVELLEPKAVPLEPGAEFFVDADKVSVEYRKLLRKYLAKN